MAIGYVVKEQFNRRNADGSYSKFDVGQVINDPALIAGIEGTSHESHVIKTTVPEPPAPPHEDSPDQG